MKAILPWRRMKGADGPGPPGFRPEEVHFEQWSHDPTGSLRHLRTPDQRPGPGRRPPAQVEVLAVSAETATLRAELAKALADLLHLRRLVAERRVNGDVLALGGASETASETMVG